MLKTEPLQGGRLIHTYSDTIGMGLLQTDTGIEYSEAVDLNPTNHIYEEIPMKSSEVESSQEEYEALLSAYNRGVNDAY